MKNLFLLVSVSFFGIGTAYSQLNAGIPDDLVQCDVNNPGDRTEVFDLTVTEATIINGNTNVVVTYHLTSGAALSGIQALPNPQAYTNIGSPEPIFARLQSTAGQGWEVISFSLIVPYIGEIENEPLPIIEADPNNDGVALFNLTENESLVLGNQDPFDYVFSYFETLEDAQINVNPIANPETYENIINPQTIFSRMDYFITGCEATIFEFLIATEGTLSSENKTIDSFSVYPNPTKDMITISSSNLLTETNVVIFDASGKSLLTEKLVPMNNKINLNVTTLENGIYFVTISEKEFSKTIKLVKK